MLFFVFLFFCFSIRRRAFLLSLSLASFSSLTIISFSILLLSFPSRFHASFLVASFVERSRTFTRENSRADPAPRRPRRRFFLFSSLREETKDISSSTSLSLSFSFSFVLKGETVKCHDKVNKKKKKRSCQH